MLKISKKLHGRLGLYILIVFNEKINFEVIGVRGKIANIHK